MEQKKIIKVKAEIMWAFLNKQNEMSGKYQVDLCNLSIPAVQALEEIGVDVKKNEDKPEKGFYIVCKSNLPIVARDADGIAVDGDRIGNGSKAVVALTTYEWKFKNKTGVSPNIVKNGLVITELVEYDANAVSVDDAEEAL